MEFSSQILLQEITSLQGISLFPYLFSSSLRVMSLSSLVGIASSRHNVRHTAAVGDLPLCWRPLPEPLLLASIDSSTFRWPSVHRLCVSGGPPLLELLRHCAALALLPRRGLPLPSSVQP
ncbi:hypothetical protein Scep_023879 [Stephania cephalantha]|uniref:Uncharacterized protein n=1 Tax=Stephania cephalantha TaxID=152367 RepID=A0AAP0F4F8_9MAGN